MELVRWNPIRDMFGFNHGFGRLFDDFFAPSRYTEDETSARDLQPVVDIYENDANFVIKAELPGIDKKDIGIDVKGRVLTLKGERSSENEVEKDKYYRCERTFGRFERSFTLPGEINVDKINANYQDGVLKIEVPKPKEHKPKQITIH